MASTVEITFTNDWIVGDFIAISISTLTTPPVASQWEWVTTRSSGFEVTTGTPTATAGETAATNFKAAFDLDWTTYSSVVASNKITITAPTGVVFDWVIANGTNGTLSVVYNNDILTPPVEDIVPMLTKSPYYVNVPFPFDTTTKINLDLYIWSGDLTSPPATATRTIEYIRPTIDFTEFNLNLANISNDELSPKVVFDLTTTNEIKDSNTNDLKWIKYIASYEDTENTIADIEDTLMAIDGYGFYLDGVNPSVPTNLVLTDCTNRKVSRDSYILLPFVNNGTITTVTAVSNNSQINFTDTINESDINTTYVQYLFIDVSGATTDDYVTVTINGSTFIYEIVDECRYTPKTIVFKNKYGPYEIVNMFKKETLSMEVKDEVFVNNYISNGTYDTTQHEIQRKNITAMEKLRLNSGFINESENNLYKQLLLSDEVYLYEDKYIPINVSTKSIEYKTRVNDKLVKYTIDFDYAFNLINRV